MKKHLLVLIAAILLSSSTSVSHSAHFNLIWEDSFSKTEKEKIIDWLNEVSSAVTETLGKYPFEINLYIHESESTREPVPWAHTVRGKEQGVRFHVNPNFSLTEFKEDWTAQHEISHLSIPFVGKENMWFSEGYASYMQYQVMWQQGVLTTEEIKEKYRLKLKTNVPEYDSDESFLEVSKQLKSRYNYPAVYWGGACFFVQADSLLRNEKNMSLNSVIRKYQKNGRNSDEDLNDLITSLDKISNSTIFSDLLYAFQNGTARYAVLGTRY